jgi:hypothetical protein
MSRIQPTPEFAGSSESLTCVQRPLWPTWAALLIGGGSALMNFPSLVIGHREMISTVGGFSISIVGLTLTVRHVAVRALIQRSNSPRRAR